ncbi:MAG: DoxX family protein [Paludibacteraceae bacterium]|nr:DoxX family protein [Paludibacteraceae bacterium]
MTINKYAHITGSVARTLLALTFLFSGFVKAIDPVGTVYKIEDYLTAFGGVFTSLLPLATTAAVLLILTEWTLGVMMLLNVRTQLTSWLALAFYVVMLPLTLYIALTNPITDCGCFGDALVLTNWQTFWKNVVLMALVVVLLCTKRHIPQTFVWWAELSVVLIAMALAGGLMLYTHYHLPLIDFRPYKIGNNIPELMEIPEGAPADEYAITLIYEKDGVEQDFTLQDYPRGDSTWRFVDQRSKLVQKGYEPPVHDFVLVDYEDEDVTYNLLESEKAVLVVMYDLGKADLTQLGKVVQLCLDTEEQGVPFSILTAATDEQIWDFIDAHRDLFLSCGLAAADPTLDPEEAQALNDELLSHWRMLFLTGDGIMLKTIVRANPGVFVIENGTITDKYNIRNRKL